VQNKKVDCQPFREACKMKSFSTGIIFREAWCKMKSFSQGIIFKEAWCKMKSFSHGAK
jgi:hypothetical protein